MSDRPTVVDGAIFDTDGVITRTADVHERAWQEALDPVVRHHGVTDRPFRHADYVEHLDGRSRYDGVDAFLRSRGIELPWGDPGDGPDDATVCGVGNAKNERFRAVIARDGVERYDTTIALVDRLRGLGVGVAVISASKNCERVLEAAGVSDRFDVRVDGVVADELGLAGKPDPAVFLEAARRLGVEPQRCAVVEDSRAGVAAGAAGGFAPVVGVDRGAGASELRAAGAMMVVEDLGEIEVDDRRRWSTSAPTTSTKAATTSTKAATTSTEAM